MSLRLRILAAIVVVLALGAGCGLALAGWQARAWLRDELTGAQRNGRMEVERALAELPRAADPGHELAALIPIFDGDRHMQARLLDANGRLLAASRPTGASPPPFWFSALLRQEIAPARLTAAGAPGRIVELVPIYQNDMAALWAQFLDLATVLMLAVAGSAVVVFLVVGEALRPLRAVGEVLPRIGRGEYSARAPQAGPPELVALGRGVNEMAVRLAAMRERNRALEEQLLTLQDEERADIARDLHDEIGPHLFAANVDAAMAAQLISAGRREAALEQVRAITTAIAHMQRLVRDILGRLRPPRLAELGLSSAIRDLTDFWRARRTGLTFEIRLADDDDALPESVQETLYRVVQESLSNAVRHGAPTLVKVVLERSAAGVRLEIANDGAAADAPAQPGYGLTGMAERVAAAGGILYAGPVGEGRWGVTVELPLVRARREEVA